MKEGHGLEELLVGVQARLAGTATEHLLDGDDAGGDRVGGDALRAAPQVWITALLQAHVIGIQQEADHALGASSDRMRPSSAWSFSKSALSAERPKVSSHVVAVLFVSGTFPWPIVLRPAEAQCGNAPTPTPQPTPTATPVSVGEVRHYHTDHLGSTQVVTDAAGTMVEQIGYQPYGEVRGRFDGVGNLITNPSAAYRYEFTGYESEILSGLMYAGARWYDPTLGLFLTHDPVRQFASPYTYTNGDPVNLTDPMGAFVGELIAGILAIAKFIADYAVPIGVTVGFGNAFGQTLANGGSFEQAFAAGVIGGVMGGVGAYGMGIVGAYVASFGNPLLSYALAAVAFAGGTYQTVESFRSGQYVAGAVGAVFVAFGVASMLASTSRAAQGGNGQTGGLSQQEQLDFAAAEYGQRFTSPTTFTDGAGLPTQVVNELRPYFPDDFDFASIRLRNGTPWWAVGNPEAVTFRDTIYFGEGVYNPNTAEGIALIGHEVAHVQQFRELGTFRFGVRYLGEYVAGRFQGLGHSGAYRNISLERSAFDLGERIKYDLGRRGY